ncbi:hypothetical protein [Streptomyces sp. NPDC050528]
MSDRGPSASRTDLKATGSGDTNPHNTCIASGRNTELGNLRCTATMEVYR